MIGFLTPEGEFIECESWEHTSKAAEICERAYNIYLCGISAEDYILEKGYVAIRARDAYMNYYTEDRNFRPLSSAQITWINNNVESFNDMQKKDLSKILEDMDVRCRWERKMIV